MVRALLEIGETDKAFEQICKLIPITHEKVTTSPFVMPNSYGYNKELNIDGESMSDWYTGSSNTLLKAIIFDMFGLKPNLRGILKVNPVKKFPSEVASITLEMMNKKITVNHYNGDNLVRKIYVNGEFSDKAEINLNSRKNKYVINIYD